MPILSFTISRPLSPHHRSLNVPDILKDRSIDSVDHMFSTFIQRLANPTLLSSPGTSRSPPSRKKSSGKAKTIGFCAEYGHSSTSPSRRRLPEWPNVQNENGDTTSERSNNSGWLQTYKRLAQQKSTPEAMTNLSKLHYQIHKGHCTVRITNVGGLLKQFRHGDIGPQSPIQCSLPWAQVTINIILNLEPTDRYICRHRSRAQHAPFR